jgi:dethiobiotin synthetase
MTKNIAIAGIHTGIGKTVASAVLARALQADYWKPVQAGTDTTDSDLLRQWLKGSTGVVHPEAHILTQPLSPHAAAAIDSVTVDLTRMPLPVTTNRLVIETAGGLLSPMNDKATMADFIQYNDLPVLLVTQHYLGSINHTLLTAEVLRHRGIPVLGLIINGPENPTSEKFIIDYCGLSVWARIPHLNLTEPGAIAAYATELRPSLKDLFS